MAHYSFLLTLILTQNLANLIIFLPKRLTKNSQFYSYFQGKEFMNNAYQSKKGLIFGILEQGKLLRRK
jgi:cyclophilin family peptidyl-prolyl cis-trans isomerase